MTTPVLETPNPIKEELEDIEDPLELPPKDDDDSTDDESSKCKVTWPRPLKEDEIHEMTAQDIKILNQRLLKCALLDYPNLEKLIAIYKHTPYYHLISRIYQASLNTNSMFFEGSLMPTGKSKKAIKKQIKEQIATEEAHAFRLMITTIEDNIVIPRNSATSMRALLSCKMRYAHPDPEKCSAERYISQILEAAKDLDLNNRDTQAMLTELLIKGVTPIMRARIDVRLPDLYRRTWQQVMMHIQDIENKFTDSDWITHIHELNQQAKDSADQTFVPRHVKNRMNKKAPSVKEFINTLNDHYTGNSYSANILSETRICKDCGHKHFILGHKTECIYPPNIEAAKIARAEYNARKQKRKESKSHGEAFLAHIKNNNPSLHNNLQADYYSYVNNAQSENKNDDDDNLAHIFGLLQNPADA